MRILVVKTGTTLESLLERRGDFEDWIIEGLGVAADHCDVTRVFEGEPLPDPAPLAGIVVTGSSAMVSQRRLWSERTAVWLRSALESGIPTLGICYGHQLLAHALGGSVGPNPRGREIGTGEVVLSGCATGDRLLRGFGDTLRVQFSHVESVLALPESAELLGSTALDPFSAFRVGDIAWGIQFHPEFDADVMRTYVHERRDALDEEGIDPDERAGAIVETPDGRAILRRFAELLRV